jgi:hypothetical protein
MARTMIGAMPPYPIDQASIADSIAQRGWALATASAASLTVSVTQSASSSMTQREFRCSKQAPESRDMPRR